MVRLAPLIAIGILAGPVLAGLVFILGSAFGSAPFFEPMAPTSAYFALAFAEPGFWTSVWLSLWIGLATALASLVSVALFVAAFSGTAILDLVSAAMRPVLAVPHAAAAFGLAFLVAPSGFLLRLVSPELSGFERPPDWLILNDPAGVALLFGLVLKELPFLLLVTLSALPQADPRRARVATALGFGRVWGWLTAVFPLVYRQIRLPVYAVVAFATSVVDVAVILGPGTPPPLAVRILGWMNDPELSMRLTAAAAALVQLGVTLLALGLWWCGEQFARQLGRWLALGGFHLRHDLPLRAIGILGTGGGAVLVLAGIALLALWSVSGFWHFPDALPARLDLSAWLRNGPGIAEVSTRAAAIGFLASAISLVLVIGSLENEYRNDIKLSWRALTILYLPLLVPQIAFLGGLSVLFLYLGIDGSFWAVVLVHLVFVLPYVYLMLADPWNSFDRRYLAVAAGLGHSRSRALFTIRLPMLLRPVLAAFALGFAVSVAQYLPTLIIGGGRQPTITTEAVALASGGDRRLIGAYALMQTLLPFAAFALAGLVPAVLWRNRRALKAGAH